MAHHAEEFDLLAGHELGDTQAFKSANDTVQEDRMLVWQKIETAGFHPCAREGHSAVSTNNQVFIFGGFETGKVSLPRDLLSRLSHRFVCQH